MTSRIRHILVAIRDLHHAPRSELHKAAALARAAGATLELYHAIEGPDPGIGWPETASAEEVARQRSALAESCERRLLRLACYESLQGLSVRCTSSWDYPAHEAIVRRALTIDADLVIAATRHHLPGARLVLRNTDWELIRHCPLPLLLVKSAREYRNPAILAAVDPFHAHARPADLDARLLDAGKSYAQLLGGTLHVFHSHMPLLNTAMVPLGATPLLTIPPEVEETHGRQIGEEIDRLAAKAGVPRACRHVQMGDVAGELAAVARRTRAELVVMGAVSRSALKRLFIGNAAERVLDRLGCDVLIVKPRGFKSGVERRPVIDVASSAVVTALRADGGAIRATVSGSDGVYSFGDLSPAEWTLSAEPRGPPVAPGACGSRTCAAAKSSGAPG
ncbi:MAG TPA: universal stress protein [Steroidobacteraceae bacterium]|nr:universal stress protein [Steroidobacteraceae bacterium]